MADFTVEPPSKTDFSVEPPKKPRPTSQSLGAEEGAFNVFDRAASGAKWVANLYPAPDPSTGQFIGLGDAIDHLGQIVGLPSEEQAEAAHRQYFGQQEKAERPGGLGRFAGEMAATVPVAFENPWLAGAAIGALTGHGKNLWDVGWDTAMGSAGAGTLHHLIGFGGRQIAPYVRTTTERATDYVRRLAEGAKKTPQDIEDYSARMFHKPVTGAEAIGRSGKTALTALGRREGDTPDKLEGMMASRKLEAPNRMLADFGATVGINPEAAQGDIDALVQQGRKEAAPLYDQIRANQAPVWNDELERIAKRPVVQKAMRMAIEDLRNADRNPLSVGLSENPVTGELEFKPAPTAEAWDLTKKALGQMVERNPFGKMVPDSVSRGNHNIGAATGALTEALSKAVPGYKEALAKAGDYLSLSRAFGNGEASIINPNVTAAKLARSLKDMTPAEIRAYNGGIANRLFTMAQNGRLKPSLLQAPAIRAKLAMSLGPTQAAEFVKRLEAEAEMAASGARMAPGTNSVTSEVLNATADQDVMNGALWDLAHAGAHLSTGNHAAAGARVMAALRTVWARGQTAGMPIQVRNEIGELLMMSPQDLAAQLRARPQTAKNLYKILSHMQRVGAQVGGAAGGQTSSAPENEP